MLKICNLENNIKSEVMDKMNKDDLQAIREIIKEELEPVKSQLKENTEILRALEHSAEVNKAEHDKMSNQIAHIEGNLESINENIDVLKDMTGRHEVDINILKRRPV